MTHLSYTLDVKHFRKHYVFIRHYTEALQSTIKFNVFLLQTGKKYKIAGKLTSKNGCDLFIEVNEAFVFPEYEVSLLVTKRFFNSVFAIRCLCQHNRRLIEPPAIQTVRLIGISFIERPILRHEPQLTANK